jgi:hypothetical protein
MAEDQCKKTDSKVLFHSEHLISYKAKDGIGHGYKKHSQSDIGQIGMYGLQNFHRYRFDPKGILF